LFLEFGENSGQDVNACCLVGGDYQLASRHFLQLIDRILGAASQGQNLLGVFGKNSPGNSEGNSRAEALEKSRVQLVFQLAHLGADSRLRAITRLSSLRETFQSNDLKKSVELVEIHAA
jgi:hypothetical protein